MATKKPLTIGSSGLPEELQSTDSIDISTAVNTQLPKGHIHEAQVEWVSVSSVKIAPGCLRSDDDSTNIIIASDISLSLSTSGKNGLDTGTEQASKFYFVWAIFNPSTPEVAGLLSLSPTAPTLPSGFTKKRMRGSVCNNASSDLLKFKKFGTNFTRTFFIENIDTTLLILSGGAATVWTTVDISSLVPTSSRLARIQAEAISRDADFRIKGETVTTVEIHAGTHVLFDMLLNSSQEFEYKNSGSGGSTSIEVSGYYEDL